MKSIDFMLELLIKYVKGADITSRWFKDNNLINIVIHRAMG
jgi:hypothetical protein